MRLGRSWFNVGKWFIRERTSPPPPAVKQWIVRRHGKRNGVRVLIETGTYHGDMIAANKRAFERLISVELDDQLFQKARETFRFEPRVEIRNGDSAKVLKEILGSIHEPCLFWLDAHYSEGSTARGEVDTPVMDELEIVLNRKEPRDVVLIDDARLFTGEGHYPTLETLERLIDGTHLSRMETRHDIIRISR
jgi:hypothetical protein